jgi:CheY-like chemotaxis protein
MARILIIAEERLARRVAWLVEGAGHAATAVYDADEGVRQARSLRPDVVVINDAVPADQLPRYTAQLEQASPGVSFIDVSHRAERGERPFRADAQLSQPFHADELLGEIERLTGGTRYS